jgi:hypothetical protein
MDAKNDMQNGDGLTLDYQRPKGRGKGILTARLPGGDSHTDKIDLADAAERDRFVKALCKERKGIDKKAVQVELERLAADTAQDGGRRPSQADVLVALAKDNVELFHTPGGHDSEGYATVVVNDHKETWPINAKGFRRWLSRLHWEQSEKAPSSEALQAALNVLSAMAVHDGPEHPVAVRMAERNGAIFLDLADDKWQVVEITAQGWRIVTDPSLKFIRRRGMLPLPAPVAGGSLNELRALVNLPDDDSWILFIAWLVAALRPGRPFPVLAVNGEQGSAKTSLCRMARALIDPNQAPLRRPPREDRDLMIAATNGWIVAFDNLSGIAPAFSDALCLLSTGGGFSTRELYTDADEKLFDATRPIMLNGIEDLATRPDLLDRALCLTLPTIPDQARRDERLLWGEFERIRPRVLGALLDAVAAALRNLSSTRLPALPRMADFALWVSAAESALPWERGAFLAAYMGNRGAANELALEASIVGGPILSLIATVPLWEGTARELLKALEAGPADEATKKHRDWPTSPRKLSGELRRLAPNLRRAGVEVTFNREPGGQRRRVIRVERSGNPPSLPSPSSQAPETVPGTAGRSWDGEDGHGPNLIKDRPIENAGKPAIRDDGDGGDGLQPSPSCCSGNDEEVVEWTA